MNLAERVAYGLQLLTLHNITKPERLYQKERRELGIKLLSMKEVA